MKRIAVSTDEVKVDEGKKSDECTDGSEESFARGVGNLATCAEYVYPIAGEPTVQLFLFSVAGTVNVESVFVDVKNGRITVLLNVWNHATIPDHFPEVCV